jgi:IclR family acetate operon transcriptional repressor
MGELGVAGEGGVRLVDLVKHTGYTRPKHGFIEQEQSNGKYRLGHKVLLLSAQCLGGLDIRRIAAPLLGKFASEAEQIAHLGIRDGNQIVFIDKFEGGTKVNTTSGVKLASAIGQRREISVTSLGKALLAFAPGRLEDNVEVPLVIRTPYSLRSRSALIDDLATARERGFTTDIEECDLGICCAAAPIHDHVGNVIAAASVTTLKSQVSVDELLRLGKKIASVTYEISLQMGAHKPRG